ncbi:MAG: glycosyltransferase [Bacteroidetes bacterium]|nr:MAG: glycosyltransferase [Bacteroidota bacterium]
MMFNDSYLFPGFVVLFWLSVAFIFYTYVFFPFFIQIKAGKKKIKAQQFTPEDELPVVSILISAFNEEEVIEKKIRSIFTTRYPVSKLEVLIGSDHSSDKTNEIVEKLLPEFPAIRFFPFQQRRGKGNVVNELYQNSTGSVLILTDANVMLVENTIFELVKFFKDESIGLVDSRMMNTNMHPSGISYQEKAYISREVLIKQHESILWGTMMGPFGGCFAIRSNLFEPVPRNFLVDDFYINMKVLEKGYYCINNMDAMVYEDISNNLSDEFRRKIRISTGNFQNLRRFSNLLWSQTKGLSFCFISHKVMRWTGPFFLLLAFVSNLLLAAKSAFYFYIFILHCSLFVLPLLDLLLRSAGVHVAVLRFVTHFYSMNLALFAGFFKSLKKIESNVWKPTRRNQA